MLKLLNIYGDNMIFQREKPIIIEGYAKDGENVYAEIRAEGTTLRTAESVASEGGWRIEFSPLSACADLEITVRTKDERIWLKNVAVGDVWLCSGQSNIECDFTYCTGTEEYVKKIKSCDIRFFNMEQAISFCPEKELRLPEWRCVDKTNYEDISVISYVFAHCVAEKEKIPIGIIKNYRGGNSIISYLKEERLLECDDGIFAAQLEREKEERRAAWSMIPCAFYNAMTAPLTRFAIRGMLWYQGETDSAYDRPNYYESLLKNLIAQYREDFSDESLPIILVQLCPFESEPFDYKRIREYQRRAAKEYDNIYLIATSDLGPTGAEGESAIHPKYKTPIGERCAAAALANVYGKNDVEWSGALVERIWHEGEDLILNFSHCGTGLVCKGEMCGFEAGTDRFFLNGVKAEIADGNKILIRNAKDAVVVRYSYANMPQSNIKNGAGIPMIPFEEKVEN